MARKVGESWRVSSFSRLRGGKKATARAMSDWQKRPSGSFVNWRSPVRWSSWLLRELRLLWWKNLACRLTSWFRSGPDMKVRKRSSLKPTNGSRRTASMAIGSRKWFRWPTRSSISLSVSSWSRRRASRRSHSGSWLAWLAGSGLTDGRNSRQLAVRYGWFSIRPGRFCSAIGIQWNSRNHRNDLGSRSGQGVAPWPLSFFMLE